MAGPDLRSASVVEEQLGRLAPLLPPAEQTRLASAGERLRNGRLRVLVAGDSKRGKSTLINALLDREILPAGVLPLTSVTTTVVSGDADSVEVTFLDGRVERYAGFGALPDFSTEAGNPANARGVASVAVRTAHPLLAAGLELVDTPGIGSVHLHNSAEARRALADMDVAIFVVSAAPPVSAEELEFLADVSRLAIETIAVLTKVDLLDPAELKAVEAFTVAVLERALGRSVRIYPTSARRALQARVSGDTELTSSSGLPGLAGALSAAALDRLRLLRVSAATQGARLAEAGAADAELTAAAAEFDAAELVHRHSELVRRLDAIRTLSGDSIALLHAEILRLVAETTDQARTAGACGAAAAVAAVDDWVTAHPAARGRHLEDGARDAGIAAGAERVAAWRERRVRDLHAAFDALEGRLEERLADQLEAVRTAAIEVFDVSLPPLEATDALQVRPSFRLAIPDQHGPTSLLAAAVRARVPGTLGRQLVLDRVRQDVGDAVEQMTGRTRSEFQAGLHEAERQLRAALRSRLEQVAAGVQHAAERGRRLAELQTDDRNLAVTEERRRAATLRDIADVLRQSTGEGRLA